MTTCHVQQSWSADQRVAQQEHSSATFTGSDLHRCLGPDVGIVSVIKLISEEKGISDRAVRHMTRSCSLAPKVSSSVFTAIALADKFAGENRAARKHDDS